MKDAVKLLIESSTLPEVDFITENTNNFRMLREASENEKLATRLNPKKIPVVRYDNKYIVEFTDGIERLMRDQDITIDEAMEQIANVNDINIAECVLIVDESAIEKIDLSGLAYKLYEVARR